MARARTVAQDFAEKLKERSRSTPAELEVDENVLATTPLAETDLRLFVGHTEERDALLAGVDACLRKVFRKIIMHGEAGIGKTSLASVAAEGGVISERYRTITLDKTEYIQGIEACYDRILSELCVFVCDDVGLHMRDKSEYSIFNGCDTLRKNLVLETQNSEEEVAKLAKKYKLVEEQAEQPFRKRDLIKVLAKKLEKHSIMLIIDDVREIADDKVKFQELISLLDIENWFSLFIMYTKELNELKEARDPLIKDAYIFEVKPLSMADCKEMLRRRILYKNKNKQIDEEPNYAMDLLPFSEKAVEIIAANKNYNPLEIIKALKDALVLAGLEKSPVVSEEIAMRVITKETKKVPLTPRLKEVLDFVREKRKVTIQDVATLRGKSRISAYFILRDLYEANLLDKKRVGRQMFYAIKTSLPERK